MFFEKAAVLMCSSFFVNGEKYENNKKNISIYIEYKYDIRCVWHWNVCEDGRCFKDRIKCFGYRRRKVIFYNISGEPVRDYGGGGEITEFIDNIAIVSKNSDNTYHVILQVENYNKIEVLQFSKPGAISDEIQPGDVRLGTYNLPESMKNISKMLM